MAGESAKFTEGNLFRHISVMSLTATVGLMAVFLVDFVDMLFISWLGQAELAAAVGYAGAILFFTTSFGIGMAIAAGALVSRAIGSGDEALARRRTTNAMIFGIVFGTVFSYLVWLNLRSLLGLVGATEETLDFAVGYLTIIVPSLPFLLVGMVGSAVLRARGDAGRAMWVTIWGGIVNAILDPILIFGLDMGLTGAALASVAARLMMAFMAIRPILREYQGFARPTTTGIVADVWPIAAIAFPAILTQVATPFGRAFITRGMAEYGEAAVAGLAIIDRMTPVAFGVLFALSGAVGPIIGQNYGAGQHDRVRRAMIDGFIFTGLVIVVVTTILYLMRGEIAALFQATGLTRDLVFLFCGPLALSFFFNGMIFVTNASFNNLGHPYYSTMINWGRNTLGTIPFILVFSAWLGAPGVLIGHAAGGVVFAAIAVWLAFRVMRENATGDAPPVPPFRAILRSVPFFHERR